MVLSNLNQICWKFQAKEFSTKKTADFKYQKKHGSQFLAPEIGSRNHWPYYQNTSRRLVFFFNRSLVVPKVARHTNPALKVHEIVDLYGRLVGKSMPYMDPMGFESPAGRPPRKINTRQKSKNPADILLNAWTDHIAISHGDHVRQASQKVICMSSLGGSHTKPTMNCALNT